MQLVRNAEWDKVGDLVRVINGLERDVAKELRARMKRDAVDPLGVVVRAAANGPHGALAAQSVKTRSGNKPTIVGAARGTGAAAAVFYGSEYGGGGRKTRYIGRNGYWRGVVTRTTTNQFRPHLGEGRGYWFNPTILANVDRVTGVVIRLVNDAMNRSFR